MKSLLLHLHARPRLGVAVLAGVVVALALPGAPPTVTRALVGWNVAVWLYLLLAAAMMWRADHEHLRRAAVAQAEGAATVLTCAVLAAVASLIGIVGELSAAKQAGAAHALPHVLFALATVAGSWLLLPTLFAATYASLYHRESGGSGLNFPSAGDTASKSAVFKPEAFKPDYLDFLYFAFTIAVASQTADISVTSRPMRRLVLLQALLSFLFNTAILAFTINIAASMF
jgi:uncharacterized membrane protein